MSTMPEPVTALSKSVQFVPLAVSGEALPQETAGEHLWRLIRAPRSQSGALLFARFSRRSSIEYPDWTAPSLRDEIRQQVRILAPSELPPVVVPLGDGIFLFSFPGIFVPLQLHLLRENLRSLLSQWAEGHRDIQLIEVAEPYTWREQLERSPSAVEEQGPLRDLMWILSDSRVSPVFQPIVSLQDGSVVGWEALCRADPISPLAMPDALFSCAARLGMLTEVDALCQERVLSHAVGLVNQGRIFVNLYPDSLLARPFEESPLVRGTKELGIPPSRIVIEITERQAIRDFPGFVRALRAYRDAGFRIAVDDAGSGYSSLQSIAELSPDFVKIDRSLVQGIDSSINKRVLVSMVVQFATRIGACLIAEGIERFEELQTVTELGIEYGQGYYLAYPNAQAPKPQGETVDQISSAFRRHRAAVTGRGHGIGEMAQPVPALAPDEPALAVRERFNALGDHDGCAVVTPEGMPVGLLMKRWLLARLAVPYGQELLLRRNVDFLMDISPVIVPEEFPIELVAHRILARDPERLDDHVIVTRDGRYQGVAPARRILEKVANLQINQAKYADPLTGLPGRMPLEFEINTRLTMGEAMALLEIDLDNLKPYNDEYGVANGDHVIASLARVLRDILAERNHTRDFLGHAGGDDFIFVLSPSDAQEVARRTIEQFTRLVPGFYTKEDNERSYIEVRDRQGHSTCFGLLTLTIAGLTTETDPPRDFRQAMERLAARRERLKRYAGSRLFVEGQAPTDAVLASGLWGGDLAS